MEGKVISEQKKEWVAPQCTVYGNVETLTMNPGGGHQGGGGGGNQERWRHGGGGGHCKTTGSCDCNRSWS